MQQEYNVSTYYKIYSLQLGINVNFVDSKIRAFWGNFSNTFSTVNSQKREQIKEDLSNVSIAIIVRINGYHFFIFEFLNSDTVVINNLLILDICVLHCTYLHVSHVIQGFTQREKNK